MGSYHIADLPGAAPGDRRRLLGATPLGQTAFLSRACRPADPCTSRLKALARQAPSSPLFAGLVEMGEGDGEVWVAETAMPSVPLGALLARAPLPPEVAALVALRLCQACATLPVPHLRLSPRNVFVRPTGELLILGAWWARLLPPEAEDKPFMRDPALQDPRADTFAAAELARVAAGGEETWGGFPLELRKALQRGRAATLRPGELSPLLEQVMGPALIAQSTARLGRLVPGGSRAHPTVPPTAPRLEITSFELAAAQEPVPPPPLEAPRALALDGRVVDEGGNVMVTQPVAVAPNPGDPPSPASGLELDEAALAHALAPPPLSSAALEALAAQKAQRRRAILRAVAVLLAVLVLGGGGAGLWLWHRAHPRAIPRLLGLQSSRAMLRVDSDPPGATVRVGSEVLGETPYIGDNDLPEGTYDLRVELAGYEPVVFKLEGGEPFRVRARLTARPRK